MLSLFIKVDLLELVQGNRTPGSYALTRAFVTMREIAVHAYRLLLPIHGTSNGPSTPTGGRGRDWEDKGVELAVKGRK